MTGKEVRAMRDQELSDELKTQRTKLYELRSQSVSEKVEDTSRQTKIRRDIARLLTERRTRAAKK